MNQVEMYQNIITNLIGAAASYNNPIILKYLIGKFGKEQIEFKCYKLNENVTDALMDGNEGKTPLMFCIDNENPSECLSILIKSGANVQCQNNNGINIFHIAALQKRIDIIIFLL